MKPTRVPFEPQNIKRLPKTHLCRSTFFPHKDIFYSLLNNWTPNLFHSKRRPKNMKKIPQHYSRFALCGGVIYKYPACVSPRPTEEGEMFHIGPRRKVHRWENCVWPLAERRVESNIREEESRIDRDQCGRSVLGTEWMGPSPWPNRTWVCVCCGRPNKTALAPALLPNPPALPRR